MEDEYEIVPEKEVEDLKKQINEIKNNPLGNSPAGRELVRAIKDLNDSVNHLVALFRDAADAMKLEEKESEAIGNKLAPMLQKLDALIDQNEKIARGIVGVADMVKEDAKKPKMMKERSFPRPEEMHDFSVPPIRVSEPMNPPSGPPPGMGTPPRPPSGSGTMTGMPSSGIPPMPPSGPGAMPPPPAAPKKKKGLFGF